ncbi:autophagy protein ATG9 [Aspergillus puulaauensis]|uniref:Autophagy-related protein 9 n=1 Tax=Aspergillus puulaauensis TaxID=1220207 RepID=A0A7R7XN18_9EURO|nr:autophagy protein atg9 [Aspergillus puulaauensis]BCS24289.1 autophagy protein atg9 [Aspergillus puulaauensis]
MMASNVLSRFLPPNGAPSVYETIRQHDDDSDASDVEERAGLTFGDDVNLEARFSDRELEDAMADAAREESPSPSDTFLTPQRGHQTDASRSGPRRRKHSNPRWMQSMSPRPNPVDDEDNDDDHDDDVPASLLMEGQHDDDDLKIRLPPPPSHHLSDPQPSHPTRSPGRNHIRWDNTTDRRPSHDLPWRNHPRSLWSAGHPNLALVDPKEKAMWMWANVENLDNFLKDVYTYFLGNGIWSILLNRILSILTFAFIVGFTTFLTNCVDYHRVRRSKTLDQILIPKCTSKMSMSSTFLLWLLCLFWIGKVFQLLLDIRRLKNMHDFYHYLLGVSDTEIQTISWQEVVSRLMVLRDSNPATAGAVSANNRRLLGSQSKQRMDAHDIANRLMRKENYLIALINKDTLDLTLPVPFLRNRQLFSRILEWNINLCIMDYVFNEQGQVRPLFLKDTHRKALSDGLRRRFMFFGIMNIFIAPFIVVYFMMHHFFRYFNEYKNSPSQLSSRQYTPLAEWKFREFNELWHLFERRINLSYPFATRYIDQFPKDKTTQVAGFVAFVSGALTSVLALASIIDPELFLGFELTHDRTVLFYLGIFGSVWAFARGMVPEDTDVFDPEYALLQVIDLIHYFPSHWKGKLHSDDVRKDFAASYQMKIVIFMEEILSMIFTPFILWFSLPKCSERVIDFFREFTVHVDGMGYLCSFAVFDFKKGTNAMPQGHANQRDNARQDPRADYFSTKDGKMLASYYGFLDNYGGNPRPGHTNKRSFHPPPTFPSLGSPSLVGLGNVGNRQDLTQTRPGPATGIAGQQSTFGAARFGPPGIGEVDSPAPSLLLDPHHQPSASGFRTANRTTQHQRHRLARPPPEPVSESVFDDNESPITTTHRTASGQRTKPPYATSGSNGDPGTGDSNVEDSWRMNLMGDEADDGDADVENVDAIVGGAGVLGLIQQFQKANKDNRPRASVGL